MEDVWQRSVGLNGLTDNSRELHDSLTGQSKQMRHLGKHHGISISLINEAFGRPGNSLAHIPPAESTSDIMTKALGPEKHQVHSRGFTVSPMIASLHTVHVSPSPHTHFSMSAGARHPHMQLCT